VEMDGVKSRASFVMWCTCGFEHIDHAISDDDMAIGMSMVAGRYTALCGATVSVASMICPPGRRCPSCEAALLRIECDSPSYEARFPTQSRGSRGRHRDGSSQTQASVGYRLFGRRK